jgi:hypothetical protein
MPRMGRLFWFFVAACRCGGGNVVPLFREECWAVDLARGGVGAGGPPLGFVVGPVAVDGGSLTGRLVGSPIG